MANAKEHGGVRAGGPQASNADPSAKREIEEQIGREILAIHHESYGRGAATVTTHLLDDLVVVMLDGLELQPTEEFLLEVGRDQIVTSVRDQFQQTIQATFRAVVERATGRRVVAFTSHLALNGSRYSVEVFKLGPSDPIPAV